MTLAAALALLALPAGGVERVALVPALTAPLAPTSAAAAQLRVDLAAARLTLPPAAPLSALVASVPRAAAAAKGVPVDALARLELAQQVLSRYDPEKFDALAADKQEAAFAELWDGWRAKGLVADEGGALDAVVLEGVRDRALTFANKSVFLGAAVLGYPLEDSMWLSHTRIADALDENELAYPQHQRWRNESGTPEFLGKTKQAQELVDAWSAAADQAAAVARQARAGSKVLPKSGVVSPEASADLARIVEELAEAGDAQAIDYIGPRDPTFAAFLLDARKPGYYLYDGEGSVISRILATKAAARLGLRRLDKPDDGAVVASVYYYRPHRLAERLAALKTESPGPYGVDPRPRLAGYYERARTLAPAAPRAERSPYAFEDARFVASSALEAPENRLTAYGERGTTRLGRYELPFSAEAVRRRQANGQPHPSLGAERWSALARVVEASGLDAKLELRVVSERWQTRDRLVAKAPGGAAIQLFALDELSRLEKSDPAAAKDFARFLAAAVEGATGTPP